MTRTAIVIAAAGLITQMLGAAQTPRPEIQRIPQFENDRVTVWKSILPPGAESTLHRHDHGRTIVGIVGGDLKTVSADGRVTVNHFETGTAVWQDPMPPGEMHRDVNDTGKTIVVIVVEMK